ncbi:MAG: YigZ family protein [Candidatus Schmidhempelia sp.]|nr:YigZ family protein [Candidatus Schmidhempelia sp.]
MILTLNAAFQYQEEIKKSRFIINTLPVSNEQQAKIQLHSYRDIAANHNCWAWKIGSQYRYSDDGEPCGTAGRPILSAIENNNCDHLIIIVTRFFGGIKLGAAGLIRAYGGCAARCLQQAPLIPMVIRKAYLFHCYYNEWPILERYLSEWDIGIDNLDFHSNGITVSIQLPIIHELMLQKRLTDLTKGRESIIPLS